MDTELGLPSFNKSIKSKFIQLAMMDYIRMVQGAIFSSFVCYDYVNTGGIKVADFEIFKWP